MSVDSGELPALGCPLVQRSYGIAFTVILIVSIVNVFPGRFQPFGWELRLRLAGCWFQNPSKGALQNRQDHGIDYSLGSATAAEVAAGLDANYDDLH